MSDITTTRREQPKSMSIYMGEDNESAERRMKALDAMAENLSVSRSKLLQMLADGKLILCVPGAVVEEN